MKNFQSCAYFYPNDYSCPHRKKRAGNIPVVDESKLVKDAIPRYLGHRQPRTFAIDRNENPQTEWDDGKYETMEKHVHLAEEAGLGAFIFDTYVGEKNGKATDEMTNSIKHFSRITTDVKFGMLAVLGSPRIILPTNIHKKEAERNNDSTRGTAERIIDFYSQFFSHKNLLRVDDKPYTSVWLSEDRGEIPNHEFFSYLKEYAWAKYKEELYTTSVPKYLSELTNTEGRFNFNKTLQDYKNNQVDAITPYALLPDFSRTQGDLQKYEYQLEQAEMSWDFIQKLIKKSKIEFFPSAVTGWDASPRAYRPTVEEFDDPTLRCKIDKYPLYPIIIDANAKKFKKMVDKVMDFHNKNTERKDIPIPICAWNEVGEGATLLPEIRKFGIDDSYLQVMKDINWKNN